MIRGKQVTKYFKRCGLKKNPEKLCAENKKRFISNCKMKCFYNVIHAENK